MSKINFDRFKDGKTKALTMSYDDGVQQDRRLIELFDKYGIKGTFHLNSGLFDMEKRISENEIKEVYKNHEISAHGFTHQSLSVTPREKIAQEILKDRMGLEKITGTPIRGMSYPNGAINDEVVEMLGLLGIEYCRKVDTTKDFALPADFLRWEGTCHHNQGLLELGRKFLDLPMKWQSYLMYVWGHAYEFDNDNNWNMIEEFCKMMSGNNNIWYASNIEIVDYVKAVRGLKFSADERIVLNQSMYDVWISVDDVPVKIKAAGITNL